MSSSQATTNQPNVFSVIPKYYGFNDCKSCCASMTITWLAVPLIVIFGALALAGVLPKATAGWVILGSAAAGIAGMLIGGNLKGRKFEVIMSSLLLGAIAVVGALGGANIMALKQMGWAAIGIYIAWSVIVVCGMACKAFMKINEAGKSQQAGSQTGSQVPTKQKAV